MPRRSSTHHTGTNQSARMKAYTFIQQKISSGDLVAGALISESTLAKEMGTSRTPVREAVGQLVAEGMLEPSPGGGIVVTRLSRQDIAELYELREALEVFAIGRAAKHGIRPADRERLESLLEETRFLQRELEKSKKVHLSEEQMKRFTVSDLSFHTLLMRLAANRRILKVVNDTRLMIRIFGFQHAGHSRDDLERIYKHHRAILQSVVNRDADGVRKLLSEHIQQSANERLEEYDLWERERHLATLDFANLGA